MQRKRDESKHIDRLDTADELMWTPLTADCPCSGRQRTDVEAIFKPHNGPTVRDRFEPALNSQILIHFETIHVSAERMMHITPDEIQLALIGRFLIQFKGVQPSVSLPCFLKGQEYIEGDLQLNLGRDSTFVVKAEFGHAPHPALAKASRKDLYMTITFLGHCEHKEGPSHAR